MDKILKLLKEIRQDIKDDTLLFTEEKLDSIEEQIKGYMMERKTRVMQIHRYELIDGTWYVYAFSQDSGNKFEEVINIYCNYVEVTDNEKIKKLDEEYWSGIR